jgi:hypothetical protein
MPTVTPLTSIFEMQPGQSNKDVTVNTSMEQLESLAKGASSIAVTTADVILTSMPTGQAQSDTIIASGALTGNRNVIFPSVARGWHVVNDTSGAHTLIFKAATGTGVVVTQGAECDIRFDGTNMVQSSAFVALTPADIGVDFGVGVMINSQTIGFRAVRAHNFAANFAGAQGGALVASTGTLVITVKQNGSSIGTITYTASAIPVFATSGGTAQALAAGDLIEFVGASTADATLGGVRITLFATR